MGDLRGEEVASPREVDAARDRHDGVPRREIVGGAVAAAAIERDVGAAGYGPRGSAAQAVGNEGAVDYAIEGLGRRPGEIVDRQQPIAARVMTEAHLIIRCIGGSGVGAHSALAVIGDRERVDPHPVVVAVDPGGVADFAVALVLGEIVGEHGSLLIGGDALRGEVCRIQQAEPCEQPTRCIPPQGAGSSHSHVRAPPRLSRLAPVSG